MTDSKVREFLGTSAVKTHGEMKVDKEKAKKAREAAQRQLFIDRAGRFTEKLLDYFRDTHADLGLTDQEAIFALALFNINLRYHYGRPQDADDPKEFDGHAALQEFDFLCCEAQRYWDQNAEE